MTETLTQGQFDALSPEEKSKISGMRHYSEEQIAEKANKSDEIVQVLFRKFFEDILASEKLVIGHLKTDEEKEATLSKPMNNLYQNAIELGATFEDIDATARAIYALADQFKKLKNTYSIDLQKLMYVMVGENYPDAVPLKTLLNLTQSFKDAKSNPQSEVKE